MSAFAADDPDALDTSYAEEDPAETTTPPIPPKESSSDPEGSHSRSRSTNPLLGGDNSPVSEMEQEVLDEYSRLLRNVNQVSSARDAVRKRDKQYGDSMFLSLGAGLPPAILRNPIC